MTLPKLVVARIPKSFALDDAAGWDGIEKITPLWLADGSAPAAQQTVVRVCFNAAALYMRLDCADRDIWGTFTQRDEPIYNEEVVEVFIGAGTEDPVRYFEFQVSPNGVLFDAKIFNPTSTRENLQVETEWDCPNIQWQAQRDDAHASWWGAFAIPWNAITSDGRVPSHCRANFYRIERPHDAEVEYSCWSPTLTNPADFHKPERFGILQFLAE